MSINVYWASLEKEWMLAQEPESIAKSFFSNGWSFDKKEKHTMLVNCPTVTNSLKNIYGIKSLYNYSFSINNESIVSDMYDQEFFDYHLFVRSTKNRMFSFYQKYVFFTEEDSLLTTFNISPFLEENKVSSDCIMPQGVYDIGKWFRNTEFVFYLRKDVNSFNIQKDDIYSYVKFHTDEKINFVQFKYTEEVDSYRKDGFALNAIPSLKKMDLFYKNFRNKKLIMREIKNNLL